MLNSSRELGMTYSLTLYRSRAARGQRKWFRKENSNWNRNCIAMAFHSQSRCGEGWIQTEDIRPETQSHNLECDSASMSTMCLWSEWRIRTCTKCPTNRSDCDADAYGLCVLWFVSIASGDANFCMKANLAQIRFSVALFDTMASTRLCGIPPSFWWRNFYSDKITIFFFLLLLFMSLILIAVFLLNKVTTAVTHTHARTQRKVFNWANFDVSGCCRGHNWHFSFFVFLISLLHLSASSPWNQSVRLYSRCALSTEHRLHTFTYGNFQVHVPFIPIVLSLSLSLALSFFISSSRSLFITHFLVFSNFLFMFSLAALDVFYPSIWFVWFQLIYCLSK